MTGHLAELNSAASIQKHCNDANSFRYYSCFMSFQDYFQGETIREMTALYVCYYLRLLGGSEAAVDDPKGSLSSSNFKITQV